MHEQHGPVRHRPVGPGVGTVALVAALVVGVASPAAAGPADDYEPGSCIRNDGIGPEPFVDVSGGAFYLEAVAWAFANGITEGTDATHFDPDAPVTRGQFATMLHRMACRPTPTGTAQFVDLGVGAFYVAAVDWLVGEGLTTGKTPTLFGPEDMLTRGELATFLHRFVGEPAGAPVAPFADNDRARFYAEGVDWLLYRGVTQGTSTTTFEPDRSITRSEVVTFLYRLNTIGDVALRLEPVVTWLASPTAAATNPVDGTVYVTERAGRVYRVPTAPDGRPDWAAAASVLNLAGVIGTSGEGGLLGVAVEPDGSGLYLSFTDGSGDSVIRRYALDPGGVPTGSPATVITVDQPQSNHNGGQIVFGPDGYLYTSFGDGGGSNDDDAGHTPSIGNGQDTTNLLGAILRIDPNGSGGYEVPASNPFVGVAGRNEIWAYGVRNPWRFTFDSETGDLWVADVGQDRREEITRLEAASGGGRGANLGWRLREGTIATPGVGGPAPVGHVGPVHDYAHPASGCVSITGGYVYRGAEIPALWGTYVYGDYCLSSLLRGWRDRAGREAETFGVSVPAGNVVSFLEDGTGELYSVSLNGTIARLERAIS